jgi:hypothetical protein
MLYLLVSIFQLLFAWYIFNTLKALKKRYKAIDARLGNLSDWVITNTEMLKELPSQIKDQEVTVLSQDAVALKLITLLTELSEKGALPHFYSTLLEQLQQKYKSTETVLRPVNGYANA